MRFAHALLAVVVLSPLTSARDDKDNPEYKAALNLLASKKADERVKGCEALGKMAEDAKPALVYLVDLAVNGNGDKTKNAAVDALRKIDRKTFEWVTKSPLEIPFSQIAKEGTDAAYMKPAVIGWLKQYATGQITESTSSSATHCLRTLLEICPEDIETSRIAVASLTAKDDRLRDMAWQKITSIKHRELAAPHLITSAAGGDLRSINLLPNFRFKENAKSMDKCLAGLKNHKSPQVREAAESARAAIEAKGDK